MLTVETIRKVKVAHGRHEKSIKEIARDLHLSRNTVRKVLRTDSTSFEYRRTVQPQPKLGPFVPWLEDEIDKDSRLPRKQRRTIKALYEELQARGYEGGYDAVRRHVQRWRKEKRQQVSQAFVPLLFAPGEAYQFDWSHEQLEIGGMPMTVKLAHVRLCHSRMPFCFAYPRESQEMFFDAHNRAFAFFGGACSRGIYDNMKTAVDKVLRGKLRKLNARFEQLCAHYLVEPTLCTPAAGWEKGQAEKQVRLVRETLLAGRRRFQSLGDLNGFLLQRIMGWVKTKSHPDHPDKTVWEVFLAEKDSMIPLPGPFDGYRLKDCRVSPTCLVRFDRNLYSVPCEAAGEPVQVKAYADKVVVIRGGRVLAEHPRQFGRGKTRYDPWHYVPLLERKPGALRNGAPFHDWKLPAPIERMRLALQRHEDWERQFVGILLAVVHHGLEAVAVACASALKQGTASRDVVLNILSHSGENEQVEAASVPSQIRVQCEPLADCKRYDQLLGVANAAQ